ncbi:hypothetical protein ACFYXH_15140 [Streptomyces sp. NPDC002730]|uniref:hypothetical protein n=1 Tax=Streptomyces sp. NPDC002730 TaxID=3364662 RepID=UPI0036900E96
MGQLGEACRSRVYWKPSRQILGLDRRDPAATPAMPHTPPYSTPSPESSPQPIATTARSPSRRRRRAPRRHPLLIGLGCDILSMAPAVLSLL